MHELFEQILYYLRGIWRHRWYALGLSWLVCLIGWVWVYKLPDEYEASARVYVDSQSILQPVLRGLTVSLNPDSQIDLMTRTLLTRPNLEKMARMTDLDLLAKDSVALDRLLEDIKENIRFTGAGRQNLYTIGFADEDPQLAKRVVQALLTIFVENTLGETRQDSDTAQRFLDKQISDYENRLIAAEQRLKEFKGKNLGVMPAEGGDYYQQLEQLSQQLEVAKLELRQAENRRDSLQRQISGEEPTFLGSESGLVNSLRATRLPIQHRIQTLEEQLDSLLLKYTERHPDVIAARQAIAALEQERDEQLAELSQQMSAGAAGANALQNLDINPVYQNLRISLGQEEANIAALQVRVNEYQQRVEDLQNRVNTVLEVETQLQALNRDYQVTRENYNQLLARRESVHISQQVEQTTDNIRFKVIEPPRAPTEPSGPDRALLVSIVMAIALGAGLALAFVLHQLRPTFDTRRSLMEVTNIPVLGSVDIILAPAMIRRERLWMAAFVLLGAVLLVTYSGLLVMQVAGIRLPGV